MVTDLLHLPVEVRLKIYACLFGVGQAVVEEGTQDENPSLFPHTATLQSKKGRSAQFLRTCRTVFLEAEPVLYSSTWFITLSSAFAGRLPCRMSDSSPLAHQVRHLTWQLHCDLMKHFYIEDVVLQAEDLSQLNTLELRCQAESWKGSICGALIDENAIVRGKRDIVQWARQMRSLMAQQCTQQVFIIENTSHEKYGRVVLRIQKTKPILTLEERLLKESDDVAQERRERCFL